MDILKKKITQREGDLVDKEYEIKKFKDDLRSQDNDFQKHLQEL